ncbi:hypothetical protein CR513_49286, partial [Mucuna pruriens]
MENGSHNERKKKKRKFSKEINIVGGSKKLITQRVGNGINGTLFRLDNWVRENTLKTNFHRLFFIMEKEKVVNNGGWREEKVKWLLFSVMLIFWKTNQILGNEGKSIWEVNCQSSLQTFNDMKNKQIKKCVLIFGQV